jgi:hypothetical protein
MPSQTTLTVPSSDVDVYLGNYSVASVLSTTTASPRSFLPALSLFHLPALRRFSFLQFLHTLGLPCSRLVGHILAPNLEDQGVQSAEASVRIVGLFPRVIGLDDQAV